MKLQCAPNFRDLGGKPAAGGRVRFGQLYRAEAIGNPDSADAEVLAALGIGLVCDLRSPRERRLAASYWVTTGADVLEMDIVADFRANMDPLAPLRDDPGEAGAVRMMLRTYDALPAACAPHLARLFERLAQGDAPALIHCTAGKDRTGFFTAMLLEALGVPEDEIMADYLLSGERPNPVVSAATREMMEHGLGRPPEEAALAALAGVRPDYLAASLARVRQDHGSTGAYLREAAALDDARRTALIARLVERG